MTTLTLSHLHPRSIALNTEQGMFTLDAGEEQPYFPFADASIQSIKAIDVLEHVTDEEAWLGECARVLTDAGTIRIQVPRRGATSWFESLNVYRYAVDVLGRGHAPEETALIGWHRQYGEDDLRAMLVKTGLEVIEIRTHSLGIAEIPTLAQLVVRDMIRNEPAAGQRAKGSRARFDRLDAHIPAGPLSRRILVSAQRISDETG